jgi:hypothetical protein
MPEPTIRVLSAAAESRTAAAPPRVEAEVDLAPENEVAHAVAEDRAAAGDDDLLDSSREVE